MYLIELINAKLEIYFSIMFYNKLMIYFESFYLGNRFRWNEKRLQFSLFLDFRQQEIFQQKKNQSFICHESEE